MSTRKRDETADGAARRAMRLAAMTAGVSGSYLGYLAQRLFLGEDARDRKLRESVFREFSPEPFAAASLGQVHSAITRTGERVAVKIQYPAIGDAIV